MKVLLIDVVYKVGSTGKLVSDLYRNLYADNNEAMVCYGRGFKSDDENAIKFGIDIETYTHAFLTRITGLTGYFSPISTKRLINKIETFKPDVIHIHELHAYFVNLKPLIEFIKEMNIPVVWTFHCEFMYTGKCGHAFDCNKWKSECNNCPQLHDYPKSLFFDFTNFMFNEKRNMFKNFNNLVITTPSNWLKSRVKESFLKQYRVDVINNGINIEIFKSRDTTDLKKKHSISDQKVVLAVAPNLMSKNKGGEWVLKLAERFEQHNIKFILIGVDNPIQSKCNNVITLGRTNNQIDLAKYYALADVFLICSERENFPTTCLESLCCGTPVIGFKSGGSEETAPMPYGMFVDYGDIDSLETLLNRVLYENILATKKECETYGKQRYNSYEMYSRYEKIYKEIIVKI